jgi:hypothetical protein
MTGKSSKRTRGEVPGLKVLFSAGALAATLSGWAILGIKDARAASGSNEVTSGQRVPPEMVVLLGPLPTVVPLPVQLNNTAPIVQPTPMRQILRSVSIPPPPAPEQADGKSHSSR